MYSNNNQIYSQNMRLNESNNISLANSSLNSFGIKISKSHKKEENKISKIQISNYTKKSKKIFNENNEINLMNSNTNVLHTPFINIEKTGSFSRLKTTSKINSSFCLKLSERVNMNKNKQKYSKEKWNLFYLKTKYISPNSKNTTSNNSQNCSIIQTERNKKINCYSNNITRVNNINLANNNINRGLNINNTTNLSNNTNANSHINLISNNINMDTNTNKRSTNSNIKSNSNLNINIGNTNISKCTNLAIKETKNVLRIKKSKTKNIKNDLISTYTVGSVGSVGTVNTEHTERTERTSNTDRINIINAAKQDIYYSPNSKLFTEHNSTQINNRSNKQKNNLAIKSPNSNNDIQTKKIISIFKNENYKLSNSRSSLENNYLRNNLIRNYSNSARISPNSSSINNISCSNPNIDYSLINAKKIFKNDKGIGSYTSINQYLTHKKNCNTLVNSFSEARSLRNYEGDTNIKVSSTNSNNYYLYNTPNINNINKKVKTFIGNHKEINKLNKRHQENNINPLLCIHNTVENELNFTNNSLYNENYTDALHVMPEVKNKSRMQRVKGVNNIKNIQDKNINYILNKESPRNFKIKLRNVNSKNKLMDCQTVTNSNDLIKYKNSVINNKNKNKALYNNFTISNVNQISYEHSENEYYKNNSKLVLDNPTGPEDEHINFVKIKISGKKIYQMNEGYTDYKCLYDNLNEDLQIIEDELNDDVVC